MIRRSIRRFANDRRGNYALMTVITMVPLMGGVALAVDYRNCCGKSRIR